MRRLKKNFPKTYATVRLVFNSKSYIYKTGWVESLKRGYPSDKKGNPQPWMNYGVTHLLKERMDKRMKTFEFGCGYSTLFYAERAESVLALEHQEEWVEIVSRKLPENAQVVLSNKGDYANYIRTLDRKFDVIVVDGIDRVNCVKNSLAQLSEAGVLILDDSSRGEYREAVDFAHQNGYKSLALRGLKPTGIGIDETTIFYRNNNCFGI